MPAPHGKEVSQEGFLQSSRSPHPCVEEYEGDRRNFGIEKCNSDWILEIDSDEHVSNVLANEILEIMSIKEKNIQTIILKLIILLATN